MELGWFQAACVLKQAPGSGKRYGDCVSKSNHMCVCLLLSFLLQLLDIILPHVTHP